MKIIREPLFHFLLAGAALFVLFSVVNKDRPGFGSSDSEIVISEGRINSITQKFAKVWQRPPTESELDGLIEAYVREEILYREALSLGLDVGDKVVRRRLAQKMEFISEDVALLHKPTDSVLQEYFELRKEEFRRETLVTFQHVYLNSEKRGESTSKDADRILAKLNTLTETRHYAELGDPSMLSNDFKDTSQREVAGMFGADFSLQLLSQPLSRWSGPIESAYGLHLVYVGSIVEGEIPSFFDVRDIVVREWTNENRIEKKKRFYESLRERYDITIEEITIDPDILTQLENTSGL